MKTLINIIKGICAVIVAPVGILFLGWLAYLVLGWLASLESALLFWFIFLCLGSFFYGLFDLSGGLITAATSWLTYNSIPFACLSAIGILAAGVYSIWSFWHMGCEYSGHIIFATVIMSLIFAAKCIQSAYAPIIFASEKHAEQQNQQTTDNNE